jgi:hypothetical protein
MTQDNQVNQPVPEKPASEMTEADAVALNADVHAPVNQQNSDRIVTDGEKDQVKAGLHAKPEAGNPEQPKKEQK